MDIDYRNVSAFCMSEHGDSQLITRSLYLVVCKPFKLILDDNPEIAARIKSAVIETRIASAANDVVCYKRAVYYGIATTMGEIIHSALYDDNRVILVSCILKRYMARKKYSWAFPLSKAEAM